MKDTSKIQAYLQARLESIANGLADYKNALNELEAAKELLASAEEKVNAFGDMTATCAEEKELEEMIGTLSDDSFPGEGEPANDAEHSEIPSDVSATAESIGEAISAELINL